MRQSFRVALLFATAALTACSAPLTETFASLDSSPMAKARLHKNCALDTLDSVLVAATNTVKRGKPVAVTGWVTDEGLRAPTDFIFMLSGVQTYARKMKTGAHRPDVAQVMSSPAATTSGFAQQLDFSPVPPGAYVVSAVQLTNTGAWICQFNNIAIVVSD